MSKLNPEVWRMGSLFVEAFNNPESDLFYLTKKTPDDKPIILIMSLQDLAQIAVAIYDRRAKARIFNPPTGDDLPF